MSTLTITKTGSNQHEEPAIAEDVHEVWREDCSIYLSADGDTVEGPYVESEVEQFWRHGKLSPSVMACWEGEDRWWPIQDARDDLGFTDKERDLLGIAAIFGVAGIVVAFASIGLGFGLIAIGLALGLWVKRG